MAIRIGVAGAGAFGVKHLEALRDVEDAEVVALVDPDAARAGEVGRQFDITDVSTDLGAVTSRADVDAVILATPTPLHAQHALACLRAGKHVQVEIPLADNLSDAEAVAETQREMGLIAMVGHTRRFNPSHQWVHRRIEQGELRIQQMTVQTHFFRRSNTNALGEPRDWTDHLLWHHAAHTVDLFQYQTGGSVVQAQAIQGPKHGDLGIAMDMSIQLRTDNDAICSLSLSFNNDGPFGTTFRYIGDSGTYVARYDDLVDGYDQPIDVSSIAVSMNGIELQDREFVAAIREGREPNASVQQVLGCYRVLDDLEQQLDAPAAG